MKHLPYGHTRNKSLAVILVMGVRAMLPASLRSPKLGATPAPWKGRLLVAVGWMIALAVQAGLLVMIAELVEVIHGVMNLYLDLAQQQLDLTSLYAAATAPE